MLSLQSRTLCDNNKKPFTPSQRDILGLYHFWFIYAHQHCPAKVKQNKVRGGLAASTKGNLTRRLYHICGGYNFVEGSFGFNWN